MASAIENVELNHRLNHGNLQAYRAPIQASSSLGFSGASSVQNKPVMNPSIAFFRNHVPGGNTMNQSIQRVLGAKSQME